MSSSLRLSNHARVSTFRCRHQLGNVGWSTTQVTTSVSASAYAAAAVAASSSSSSSAFTPAVAPPVWASTAVLPESPSVPASSSTTPVCSLSSCVSSSSTSTPSSSSSSSIPLSCSSSSSWTSSSSSPASCLSRCARTAFAASARSRGACQSRAAEACLRAFSSSSAAPESDTSSSTQSPYEVLEVHPSADAKELREAYVRQCRRLHPETGSSPNASEQAFKDVKAAWWILSDPARRKDFDKHGTVSGRMEASAEQEETPPRQRDFKSKIAEEEGDMMKPPEFPPWFVFGAPFTVFAFFALLSCRQELFEGYKEQQLLRNGGWPCPKCLIVNEPDALDCMKCKGSRADLNPPPAAPSPTADPADQPAAQR